MRQHGRLVRPKSLPMRAVYVAKTAWHGADDSRYGKKRHCQMLTPFISHSLLEWALNREPSINEMLPAITSNHHVRVVCQALGGPLSPHRKGALLKNSNLKCLIYTCPSVPRSKYAEDVQTILYRMGSRPRFSDAQRLSWQFHCHPASEFGEPLLVSLGASSIFSRVWLTVRVISSKYAQACLS